MCQSYSKSQLFPCFIAFLQVKFMFLADLSLSRGYDLTRWRSSASLVVDQSVTEKIYGDRQNIQDTEREITRFIQSLCTKADITDNLLNGLDRSEVQINFSSP